MENENLKHAVIVGASSGIGAELARRLAHEGYQLTVLARREDRLKSLCDSINSKVQEKRARHIAHDATDFKLAPQLLKQIIEDMGGVDLFIYNSGTILPLRNDEFDFSKDKIVMDVNILGAMAWLNPVAEYLLHKRAGQIVGISSVGGERGRIGAPAYNTSKAALNTYLEALRNRLSRHNVHVLTVKPGFIATEMLPSEHGFWIAPVDVAINDIWKAILARKQEVYTPARWRWVAVFMRNMPSIYWREFSRM